MADEQTFGSISLFAGGISSQGALRLGADRVLVIGLSHGVSPTVSEALAQQRTAGFGNPMFLFGKVLEKTAAMQKASEELTKALAGIVEVAQDGSKERR